MSHFIMPGICNTHVHELDWRKKRYRWARVYCVFESYSVWSYISITSLACCAEMIMRRFMAARNVLV